MQMLKGPGLGGTWKKLMMKNNHKHISELLRSPWANFPSASGAVWQLTERDCGYTWLLPYADVSVTTGLNVKLAIAEKWRD